MSNTKPGRDAEAASDAPEAGIRLVVNADDFGYSREVSRGILACAHGGGVTATGVFGNCPDLDEAVRMLAEAPALEVGVHLALSHGAPVTDAMRGALRRWRGAFPGKYAMAGMITCGWIREEWLREELRAQVEACAGRGLAVRFLNAHEHLHMHPRVRPIVREIADAFGVRFVRVTRPDLVPPAGLGARVREAIIGALGPGRADGGEAGVRLVGLAQSGRIDFAYLERLFGLMRPGETYELMCHPGYADAELSRNERLRRYHDWDLEREALTDPRLPALLRSRGIRLVRFAELAEAGRLAAREP